MVFLVEGFTAESVGLFVFWTLVTVAIAAVTRRSPREALALGVVLGPIGALVELGIVVVTLYRRRYARDR